jgi:hypothetical protein
VAGYTPASVGESQAWNFIISTVEENRTKFCKALSGKTLYSALYGTYAATLTELKDLLKVSVFSEEKGNNQSRGEPQQEEDFQEVHRRKRQNTDESAKTAKKAAV